MSKIEKEGEFFRRIFNERTLFKQQRDKLLEAAKAIMVTWDKFYEETKDNGISKETRDESLNMLERAITEVEK